MVDDQLTSELAEIEVNEAVRGETTFRVRFAIDICSTDMELLNDDRLVPGVDRKITVLVSLGNVTSCLVHGFITDRKAELKEGGPGSSVEISGKDRRVEMSRNGDQRGPRNGTVGLIVASILSQYNFFFFNDTATTEIYTEETKSL